MDETRHEGPSCNKGVRAMLIRQFPKHAAAVERLIAECEHFRDLCDDYLECRAVLRRLGQPGDASRHGAYKNYYRERMYEYEEMRAGLEQELLNYIEDRAICPRCDTKRGGEPKVTRSLCFHDNRTLPATGSGLDAVQNPQDQKEPRQTRRG